MTTQGARRPPGRERRLRRRAGRSAVTAPEVADQRKRTVPLRVISTQPTSIWLNSALPRSNVSGSAGTHPSSPPSGPQMRPSVRGGAPLWGGAAPRSTTNRDVEHFYSFRPAGHREVYRYACASRWRIYGVIGLHIGKYPKNIGKYPKISWILEAGKKKKKKTFLHAAYPSLTTPEQVQG